MNLQKIKLNIILPDYGESGDDSVSQEETGFSVLDIDH